MIVNGLVMSLYGVPYVGKSSLVKSIQSLSRKLAVSISSGDISRSLLTEEDRQLMRDGSLFPREEELRNKISSIIDNARDKGARVIFLDGFPRTSDQVKWLYDNKYVGHNRGYIIKVEAGDQYLEERSKTRKRSDDNVATFQDKLRFQRSKFPEIEDMMSTLGLFKYFSVVRNENNAKDLAVRQLKTIAGL